MTLEPDFTFEVGSYTPENLFVRKFQGREGISELFHYQVEAAVLQERIDFSKVVGKPGLITVLDPKGQKRYVSGLVNRCEFLSEDRYFLNYRFEMVPSFWFLKQRTNHRIFQNKSIPQIIETILGDQEITSNNFQMTLKKVSRDPREYCVQYGESDFDFVSRLMEEVGIFYFFDHKETSHTMIIADDRSIHKKIESPPTVVFREKTGLEPDRENVFSYRYQEKIRSGAVSLRDYNFIKPTLDMESSFTYKENQNLERYEYPGKYDDKSLGDGLAEIRLQEQQVERKVGIGQSNCRRLVSGCLFTMDEHPNPKFNGEYLLVSVAHQGSQNIAKGNGGPEITETTYRNKFKVVPGDLPFRSPRSTGKPRIIGNQTAVVVGPDGEEIDTDAHGRIKVKFPWDRGEKTSSCWVRVTQLWAGSGWGGLFIPRIGQEVVVCFLDGDPDRPLVVGCVYNGDNPPPYALPDEMTKSTIKSDSSIGGGGSNEIRFEDASGREEIYLHGQKNWNIVIENNKSEKIKHDLSETIAHDQTRTVKNNETVTIENNSARTVNNDVTETIGNNKELSVGVDSTENVGSNKSLNVGADYNEAVGGTKSTGVGGGYSLNAQTIVLNASDSIVLSSGGSITLQSGGRIEINSGSEVVIAAPRISLAAGTRAQITGSQINLAADSQAEISGPQVKLTADSEAQITGPQVKVSASGTAEVSAGGVTTIKGSQVKINS